MATKLEGGGGKVLVAEHLKKNFFAGSLKNWKRGGGPFFAPFILFYEFFRSRFRSPLAEPHNNSMGE